MANHQFPPQIHHFLPHAQQSPHQILPPPQTHQPLHQVIPPPPTQAHQPSKQLPQHNLHLNLPPFQGHVNFRPINHSHTSQSTPYLNPTITSPSPISPTSSPSSPNTYPIGPSFPRTSTPRQPLRCIHY